MSCYHAACEFQFWLYKYTKYKLVAQSNFKIGLMFMIIYAGVASFLRN